MVRHEYFVALGPIRLDMKSRTVGRVVRPRRAEVARMLAIWERRVTADIGLEER